MDEGRKRGGNSNDDDDDDDYDEGFRVDPRGSASGRRRSKPLFSSSRARGHSLSRVSLRVPSRTNSPAPTTLWSPSKLECRPLIAHARSTTFRYFPPRLVPSSVAATLLHPSFALVPSPSTLARPY